MLCKETDVAAQNEESLFQESKMNPSYQIVEDIFSSSFEDKNEDLLGIESEEFQQNDVDSWILQSIAEVAQIDKSQP